MGLILISALGGLSFPWLLVYDYRLTPTFCLPLAGVVISFLCCILHLPVFFTPIQCPKCPPDLGVFPSLLAPCGGSAQGCGSWNLEQSWHMLILYPASLPGRHL